jgi:hypothetical protein
MSVTNRDAEKQDGVGTALSADSSGNVLPKEGSPRPIHGWKVWCYYWSSSCPLELISF